MLILNNTPTIISMLRLFQEEFFIFLNFLLNYFLVFWQFKKVDNFS